MDTNLANSMSYRRAGYRVVFRNGVVYLGSPEGAWHRAAVNNGAWLGTTPTSHPQTWSAAADLPFDADALKRVCYCSSLSTGGCDFCHHVRLVPTEESL